MGESVGFDEWLAVGESEDFDKEGLTVGELLRFYGGGPCRGRIVRLRQFAGRFRIGML